MIACQCQCRCSEEKLPETAKETVLFIACFDPEYFPGAYEHFSRYIRPLVVSSAGATGKLALESEQFPILEDIQEVVSKKLGVTSAYLVGHNACKWIMEKYQLDADQANIKQLEILDEAKQVLLEKTKIRRVTKYFLHKIKGKIVPEIIED